MDHGKKDVGTIVRNVNNGRFVGKLPKPDPYIVNYGEGVRPKRVEHHIEKTEQRGNGHPQKKK